MCKSLPQQFVLEGPESVRLFRGHNDESPPNDHIDSQLKWCYFCVNMDVEIVTVSQFHISIVNNQCPLCRTDVLDIHQVSFAFWRNVQKPQYIF